MSFCSSLGKCCRRRICDLPEDILVRILLFVPTKDAVATSILSKRWRYIWTMLPELNFKDVGGCFIDKSLQLHKAPTIKSLVIELGPQCPVDNEVDVGNWAEKAGNNGLEALDFKLLWKKAEPTRLPMSLYRCGTLVSLTLSDKILVDVSFEASLPSLLNLDLFKVVYKDQDSLVRLLSSSPVLKYLNVERHVDDNLTDFTVKVSSLKTLYYKTHEYDEENDEEEENIEEEENDEEENDEEEENEEDEEEEVDHSRSLVKIDCPALTFLTLRLSEDQDHCLIEDMPCLRQAYISIASNTDEKFLRCLSSARTLGVYLTGSMVASCNAIKFSRLRRFCFCPKLVDWFEPLICLLQNFPNLKSLVIATPKDEEGYVPSSWNIPSTTPECLSSRLESLRWNDYGGREDEKQLVRYILANSKCLKTLEISFIKTCNLEECQKELESMSKTSASSPLLYFPTKANWKIF